MAANDSTKLTEKEAVQLGELVKAGKIPLKLVTGNQTSGRVTLLPGAVHAEENATVIFVCG